MHEVAFSMYTHKFYWNKILCNLSLSFSSLTRTSVTTTGSESSYGSSHFNTRKVFKVDGLKQGLLKIQNVRFMCLWEILTPQKKIIFFVQYGHQKISTRHTNFFKSFILREWNKKKNPSMFPIKKKKKKKRSHVWYWLTSVSGSISTAEVSKAENSGT